jgi:hypothetical protein
MVQLTTWNVTLVTVLSRFETVRRFLHHSQLVQTFKTLSFVAVSVWGGGGQGILKGTYHCTIDLLFDRFGITFVTTDSFYFYLQNRQNQTSQTGGQWNSDFSPFSIPCGGN